MRVLLKVSGEALKGDKDFGIDSEFVEKVVLKIKEIKDKGIELVIVIGGGNIYRGSDLIASGVNSADSHSLSMLSTVFNGVVLKNFLGKAGLKAVVLDPNGINFVESYNKNNAKKYIEEGYIIICTGGTGNPYFTTDTGGVLRSLELSCDIMIKGTKVNGIYDKDPMKYSDALFYENISYDDVIAKNLKILDQTAVSLAKDNKLKIMVCNLAEEGAILNCILTGNGGSTIS